MRTCPKVHFRCRREGCTKEHHTLLHPSESSEGRKDELGKGTRHGSITTKERHCQTESKVTVATGAGERVCLSVVPVKVKIKGRDKPPVVTYALLDSGSEITLVHQKLQKELGAHGPEIDFLLSGINGSKQVNSERFDIVVTSVDERTSLELSNVRTVQQMPISRSCIARKEDVKNWPHLGDVPITEIEVDEITLVIGLQEKPSILLQLEYHTGGKNDPIAIRYSLGWTVIGPTGEKRENTCYSTNFARTVNNTNSLCANPDTDFEDQHAAKRRKSSFEIDYKDGNSLMEMY